MEQANKHDQVIVVWILVENPYDVTEAVALGDRQLQNSAIRTLENRGCLFDDTMITLFNSAELTLSQFQH
jgi:hypothetical protein